MASKRVSSPFSEIKSFNNLSSKYAYDRLFITLDECDENVKVFLNELISVDEDDMYPTSVEEVCSYFGLDVSPIVSVSAIKSPPNYPHSLDYYEISVLSYVSDKDEHFTLSTNLPFPFNKQAERLISKYLKYDEALTLLDHLRNCEHTYFKSDRKAILKFRTSTLKVLRPNTNDMMYFFISGKVLNSLGFNVNLHYIFEFRMIRNDSNDKNKKYTYSIHKNNDCVDEYGTTEYETLPASITESISYDELINLLFNIETTNYKSSPRSTLDFHYITEASYY